MYFWMFFMQPGEQHVSVCVFVCGGEPRDAKRTHASVTHSRDWNTICHMRARRVRLWRRVEWARQIIDHFAMSLSVSRSTQTGARVDGCGQLFGTTNRLCDALCASSCAHCRRLAHCLRCSLGRSFIWRVVRTNTHTQRHSASRCEDKRRQWIFQKRPLSVYSTVKKW